MSRLLQHVEVRSSSTTSPIGFTRVGGGAWKDWDRFLTLDGKPAYQIGNICNTCSFFFQRMTGANRSVEFDSVVTALTGGLTNLSPTVASQLAQTLPEGEYIACFLHCSPVPARPGSANDYFSHEQTDLFGRDPFWDLPRDPRTEYYRLETAPIASGRTLFEFLVPMFPARWLKTSVVNEYVTALSGGAQPTAIAVSILDAKGPADPDGEELEHLCLAHYLLDGHHKVLAAAQTGRIVSLVSFLAVNQGISQEEDRRLVLAALGASAG
jgi:hypothetical protein